MSTIPLIIENHPDSYDGLPFLTLVRYNNTDYLTVIDNITDGELRLYNIELCSPFNIDVSDFLQYVSIWHETDKTIPLSVFISANNLTPKFSPLYVSFSIEYVSRVIGPLPKYKLKIATTPKKRKRKSASPESGYVIKNVHELEALVDL